ncbi:hypothetical protein LARI1_G009243 [Lachnellula arida]|uniref:Uncharacterized protein n=1 Tax=Lachnellula arida TaxID=1316785 RepID=A0A8T9B4K3_9HELO|nr:hypothetical protein LARI1_G009243 [Lachnellula arida]
MPSLSILKTNTQSVSTGTNASFGVLGASEVTSTGATTINGNVGIYPGTSITGLTSAQVMNGVIHNDDAVAMQAQANASTTYNMLAGLASTEALTGQDLGGQTLVGGTYTFTSSAQLTGQLTLDGSGTSDSQWVFQIASSLTTASASSVLLTNGAQACNVFWQIGTSATIGTATSFQ